MLSGGNRAPVVLTWTRNRHDISDFGSTSPSASGKSQMELLVGVKQFTTSDSSEMASVPRVGTYLPTVILDASVEDRRIASCDL